MPHDFSRHNAIVGCLRHRPHQNTADEIQEPRPVTNDTPVSGGGDGGKPAAKPPVVPSAGEAGFRHAPDTETVDRKQRAAQHAVAGEARQWRLGHRGNKQHIQVRTAEHHAGHFPHRHLDHAVHTAIRPIAHQLADIDMRAPYTAFRIHRRPVEAAAIGLRARAEGALVGDRAGALIVIIGGDFARPGIGEIERAAVRAGPKTMRAGWARFASMATGFIIAAQSNA